MTTQRIFFFLMEKGFGGELTTEKDGGGKGGWRDRHAAVVHGLFRQQLVFISHQESFKCSSVFILQSRSRPRTYRSDMPDSITLLTLNPA